MAENEYPQFFRGATIPESVRSQIMAAQLLQQSAAQASQPYTSKGVNVLKGFSGLFGGLMEGSSIHGEQAAQAAHRTALASLLAQPQGGAAPSIGMAGAPAPGQPISSTGAPQSSDARDLAIRTIYGEAGGEPATGQAGVAAVLKNRLASGQYGNDMSSVITAPKQFSLWNAGDPAGATARKLDPSSPAYQKIGSIYDGVMSGQIPDPTGGATHYYNPSAASPAWGPQLAKQNDVTIGNHRFVGGGPAGPGAAAQADMPAPNATPTGSSSLPPGVTADMIGGSTASPYGGPPKPMSTANIVTAAMAKAGMDTSGLPGAAAPQPAPGPFGTLRPMSPPPAPAASPSPPAAPASPFGGPPQPMGQQQSPQQSAVMAAMLAAPQPNTAPAAPQPDPDATTPDADTSTSPQVAKSSGADPALMTAKPDSGATPIMPDGSAGPSPLLASQADPGASAMLPASPPLPPPGVQTVPQGNPYGGPPQPMTPSPQSAVMASMLAAPQPPASPVSAAPLSTDSLPGMDNFNSQGDVTQSSLGAAGYTGAPSGMQAQINGNLPGPQAYVGGDMGLGTPSAPVGPSVAASGPSVAPAGPPPQMIAGNLPAPTMSPMAAALAQGAPGAPSGPAPASALPQTGPMPPAGAQSLAALNPDAPAPGSINAGPAPIPPDVLAAALRQGAPQPMGLAGKSSGSDPMSAQNFNQQAMARALLQGAPGVVAPASPTPASNGSGGGNPLASLPLIGGMFGGGQASQQAPAGVQQVPSTPSQSSGGGLFSSLLGGSQQQAPQMPAGLTQQQQQMYALMADPRTSPQEAQMLMQRFGPVAPTIEKTADGKIVAVNPRDMSSRVVYDGSPKADWTPTADGTRMINKATSEVRPMPGYGDGSGGWRSMTSAERTQFGVTDGRPAYMAPNGEPHFGMPETQGQGETAEAKTAGEGAAARRGDMLSAADAAPEKIARLNLLGAVLDKTQTGPLAPEIGNAASIAQRLGVSNDRLAQLGIDPNAPVNNAIANKLAGEMTMGSIGAKNGGMPASNFSVAERQFIEALYPNIENQAGGNRAVTDVLSAVEQRKLQTADAWSNYKDTQRQAGKPLSYEDFEDQFRQQHAGDNIFAPIIQKYQAGGYTPTVPTAGGNANAAPPPAAPQAAPPPPSAGGQQTFMPGASAPPTASAAPTPQAPRQAAPAPSDALAQAQAAIAKGVPRAAVMQRLQSMGVSTQGL